MAGTADQVSDEAVELDVSGAADQIASLLDDDDDKRKDQDDANHSSQSEEQSSEGADEESQEQTEEQQGQTYAVRVDGKESQVTLDELVNGYQRNADYTQKTMQLSAQRREQQAEFEAVKQERAQYAHLLKLLDAQLADADKEPNWDELRQVDPVGYATKWAQHMQLQQRRGAIQAEQQRLAAQQLIDQQAQLREHIAGEAQRLVENIPAWKDEAKAKDERKALVEYGLKQGFSTDELNNVYDHRAVSILYKAWKYDQALAQRQAAQARVGAAPAKTLVPGQGNNVPRGTAITKAKQRLAQTGSVEDAATLFERLL